MGSSKPDRSRAEFLAGVRDQLPLLLGVAESQQWLIVLGGMLATYLVRLSFIALIPHDRFPPLVRRGLNYIPSAVLAAILLPELALTDSALNLLLANERLLAGLAAAIVAWRLQNTWLTIATGMLALWLLLAL